MVAQHIGQAGGQHGGLVGVVAHLVPELEARAHADQQHVALDTGPGAQLGRDQQARSAIDLHIHRAAEENAAPVFGRHRQPEQLGTKGFPGRAGKDQQAALGVLGDGELVVGDGFEHVAVAGRHSHATLAVEEQPRSTLKHEISHAAPQTCTFPHFNGGCPEGQRWIREKSIKSST